MEWDKKNEEKPPLKTTTEPSTLRPIVIAEFAVAGNSKSYLKALEIMVIWRTVEDNSCKVLLTSGKWNISNTEAASRFIHNVLTIRFGNELKNAILRTKTDREISN